MIRILHTIDTTGPGGAETVFLNLAKGLDSRHFESFAAITGPGWVSDELRNNGIKPIFIRARGGFNIQYLLDLGRIIREYKIDLVQSHLLGSNVYCSLVGLICHVPVISTFHGFADTSNKERLMSIKRCLVNLGAKKIVFVSDRLREHFVREYRFSVEKSVTIYNGIDTSVFKPQPDCSIRKELGLTPENVLIGAVGNIRPAKGYEYFLKAARLIHEKHPECRFVIAGEGSGVLYDDLLKLRNELSLQDIFFFLGFRDDVPKVLNNFDIFVLSSVSEGFSISTIEAMSCGIPVVVTRSGGPEEIILDGENGIMVESKDYIGISEAIIKIMRFIQFKNNIINSGYKLVYEKFSHLSMIKNYKEVYFNIHN